MRLLERHARSMSKKVSQSDRPGGPSEHGLPSAAVVIIETRQDIRMRPSRQDPRDGFIEFEEALLNTLQCGNGGQQFRHRRKPHDRVGAEQWCFVVHCRRAECSDEGVS